MVVVSRAAAASTNSRLQQPLQSAFPSAMNAYVTERRTSEDSCSPARPSDSAGGSSGSYATLVWFVMHLLEPQFMSEIATKRAPASLFCCV